MSRLGHRGSDSLVMPLPTWAPPPPPRCRPTPIGRCVNRPPRFSARSRMLTQPVVLVALGRTDGRREPAPVVQTPSARPRRRRTAGRGGCWLACAWRTALMIASWPMRSSSFSSRGRAAARRARDRAARTAGCDSAVTSLADLDAARRAASRCREPATAGPGSTAAPRGRRPPRGGRSAPGCRGPRPTPRTRRAPGASICSATPTRLCSSVSWISRLKRARSASTAEYSRRTSRHAGPATRPRRRHRPPARTGRRTSRSGRTPAGR